MSRPVKQIYTDNAVLQSGRNGKKLTKFFPLARGSKNHAVVEVSQAGGVHGGDGSGVFGLGAGFELGEFLDRERVVDKGG
jgi:hypothetical protein